MAERVLVERAMAGDRLAFDELAARWVNRLYGIASLILRDPDQASDATQEALISAWRDLSALRDADRFGAWLNRLLVRACHREARRARGRLVVEVGDASLDVRPARDDLPGFLDRDQLERGFRRLDVEHRAILVLHHLEGFTLAEIGEVLGMPVGTVKSRLHRALGTMRAALDADARVVSIDRGRIA
ncbi:MAG TPA: sigma-70 family RNA polymerase sigma factor [Candidatus Limnocylindrales bacterium]|nr:sigma-70 family RNA polymerase sigma factor [Candidatus Limnocylindrales bacterium]